MHIALALAGVSQNDPTLYSLQVFNNILGGGMSSRLFQEARDIARIAATGGVWPPKDIATFDPWHLPLLNTLILLTSGTTVTWAHHALLENDRQGLKYGLILTILLGASFTCVQAYEYAHVSVTSSRAR